jgi:hypothetical protein
MGTAEQANASLASHVEWFNTALKHLNDAALETVNQRLRQIGATPRKSNLIRPFTLEDPAALTVGSVQAMARRLHTGFSQANLEKSLIDSLLPAFAGQFTEGINAATGMKMGKGVDKAKSDRKALFKFIRDASTLNKNQILSLLDSALGRLEADNQVNPFSAVINQLALSTTEGQELIQNQATTLEQQQARRHAEETLAENTKQLTKLQKDKAWMLDSEGVQFVGKFRHNLSKKDANGQPLGVNVAIELVAPQMSQRPNDKPRDIQNRKTEWNNNPQSKFQFII